MKAKDETGNKYGRLTVLYRDTEWDKIKKDKSIKWVCQCDCGATKSVYINHLRNGHTQSCGCLNKEKIIERNHNKADNLIGQTFGRLTVIDKVLINNKTQWKCKCQCGKEIIVSTAHLRSGHTQSCGCLQRECAQQGRFIDETGNKYGKLTVLEFAGWSSKRGSIWKCKCDCGNLIEVEGTNLKTGNTKSCGCLRRSFGEERVEELLNNNNIPYISEYSFEDLISPKGNPLRFDFCILKSGKPYYFIECDGLQHTHNYQAWPDFDYQTLILHDKIKETYLRDKGYSLIRIPYKHYNKIELKDLLLTSDFKKF